MQVNGIRGYRISEKENVVMSDISARDWEESLRGMSKEERISTLHYSLRNIPRDLLEEYLSTSEEEVTEIFNNNEL